MTAADPLRFSVPLYTVADVARIVGAPPSTIGEWAKGYSRRFRHRSVVTGEPVITHVPTTRPRQPSIPFIGLAEALVLAAVRRSGVPMQRVRPALQRLQAEIGLEHALASRKLYTDGAEILFDFSEEAEPDDARDVGKLVIVRNGQRVFTEVIAAYLQRVQYSEDGYASLIRVPAYEHAKVIADPTRSFGAPIFERGGARVDDVLDRFWAGETLSDLAEEFGVPGDQLEDVLRVASRRAA